MNHKSGDLPLLLNPKPGGVFRWRSDDAWQLYGTPFDSIAPANVRTYAMKSNESSHSLIATHCCRTGRQCPAALNLARKLSSAGKLACLAQPDFEMTGESRLDGCSLTCIARFALSQEGVELYCGAEPDDDLGDLASFANGFVSGGDSVPPNGDLTHPPLAFVLVPVDAQRAPSEPHEAH